MFQFWTLTYGIICCFLSIPFSFGQTAIFLLGGKTKEVKPAAMFLKSGDIVVMSKESRLSYHAVPKIVKTNVDWISEVIDNHADDSNDADSVWQKGIQLVFDQ